MERIMTDGKRVGNGVNVEALLGAREALTSAPEAARFRWRAATEWKNGTHSHSTAGDDARDLSAHSSPISMTRLAG